MKGAAIYLIMKFCMVTSPWVCDEVVLEPDEGVGSFYFCMSGGQEFAADYLKDHPKSRLVETRCVVGKKERAA